MVYHYESFRPSASYSEANRSRSSSVSRYSSPARSSYGSTSRDGTSLETYRVPTTRSLLQETNDSPYSSRRSSLSSSSFGGEPSIRSLPQETNDSFYNSPRSSLSSTSTSGASSLRTLLQETNDSLYSSRRSSLSSTSISGAPSLRNFLQETNNSTYSSRRSSLSSTGTSGSSRSSLSREFPSLAYKHSHFKTETKESDPTNSLVRDRGSVGFDSAMRFSRERMESIPRASFENTSNDRMKMSIRGKFDIPSASSDACRRRQARAAYLSALDDSGVTIKSNDTM